MMMSIFQMLRCGRRGGGAVLFAVLVGGAVSCRRDRAPEGFPLPGMAEPAGPVLELRAPSLGAGGGDVSLADYRGKVVLADFWASWSAPCRAEQAGLMELQDLLKDRGLTVIGLSVDVGERAGVAEAVGRCGLPYPVGWADAAAQAAAGGIRALPTKLLLDKTGRVVRRYEGSVPLPTVRADIESLLGRP
jgi:thiol-disulfide isomerase/thioredoxin